MTKSFQIQDHLFVLLLLNDSENLKSLHIGLCEVGAKKRLKGVRNTNTKKILLSKAKFAQKKSLDSGLWEVGAKRHLNGVKK